MSKKVFTILLLAVFMLAQFSVASAATAPGTATISLASPWGNPNGVSIDWTVTGLNGLVNQDIIIWSREKAVVPVAYAAGDCQVVANIVGSGDALGTYDFDLTLTALALADQDTVEFAITVDDAGCAGTPPADSTVNASAFIDANPVTGLYAVPPYDGAAAIGFQPVACNTFEMWALASDNYGFAPTDPYSGFGGWRQRSTGTFAPPAPEGDATALLSWPYTIPSTAVNNSLWSFEIWPFDAAFNFNVTHTFFRNALPLTASVERVACEDFTDTAGHEDEVYIRYLADLGLISGFADGTYGPDTTLSRAEAATLFEISNGYVPATLPTSAPSALCSFSDVAPTDWFAGWVWQACDDGYMNGIGGGLFDPNNLLTRGQIVTIMNNVADAGGTGGYLDNAGNLINAFWGVPATDPIRTAVFTDVFVGAFYAYPVERAYGFGVAEGTTATTFSPDQPVLRGEFAKMLYRGLSNTAAIP